MRKLDTIICHHSASPVDVLTWEDIRRIHVEERGWSDCGYHFGVCRDDGKTFQVKQGRPVHIVGAHAKGHNATSIGVCFEGNFDKGRMPEAQFLMGATLISRLMEKYGIGKLIAHRDVAATNCCGKYFPMETLRGWIADEMRFNR